MEMKIYICKKCQFSGIRPEVRKHVREEHMIGRRVYKGGDGKHQSDITKMIEVRKWGR